MRCLEPMITGISSAAVPKPGAVARFVSQGPPCKRVFARVARQICHVEADSFVRYILFAEILRARAYAPLSTALYTRSLFLDHQELRRQMESCAGLREEAGIVYHL